jgi:hypothetical protein
MKASLCCYYHAHYMFRHMMVHKCDSKCLIASMDISDIFWRASKHPQCYWCEPQLFLLFGYFHALFECRFMTDRVMVEPFFNQSKVCGPGVTEYGWSWFNDFLYNPYKSFPRPVSTGNNNSLFVCLLSMSKIQIRPYHDCINFVAKMRLRTLFPLKF